MIANQAGQGMTEYIVIVALIAVAAIGTFRFFGQTARNQVAGMSRELAGEDAKSQLSDARQASSKAVTKARANTSLKNYDGQNK